MFSALIERAYHTANYQLVELVMAENGNVHVQGLGALLVGLCFQVDDHDEGQGASSAINT
jgi:hypothetical protein